MKALLPVLASLMLLSSCGTIEHTLHANRTKQAYRKALTKPKHQTKTGMVYFRGKWSKGKY